MTVAENGHANGATTAAPTPSTSGASTSGAMTRVFTEAHTTLADADPELYAIIEQEKLRQWCACGRAAPRPPLQAVVPLLARLISKGKVGWGLFRKETASNGCAYAPAGRALS